MRGLQTDAATLVVASPSAASWSQLPKVTGG